MPTMCLMSMPTIRSVCHIYEPLIKNINFMNEIILLILVVVVLFMPRFLISKLTPKNKFLVQTSSAIVLMLLVWIFGPDKEKNSIFLPLLITVLVVSHWLREFAKYNKIKRNI